MELKWNDTLDIAIELDETYPTVDPKNVGHSDLHNWVCKLGGFTDDPDESNDTILESIQNNWIEERY